MSCLKLNYLGLLIFYFFYLTCKTAITDMWGVHISGLHVSHNYKYLTLFEHNILSVTTV